MAYSTPEDFAWLETPPPNRIQRWINLPTTAASYSVHQDAGWSISNPTPDTLRITSTITGTVRDWTTSQQTGLVLISPQPVSPYSIQIPTAKSAQPWDSSRAILRVAARVKKGGAAGAPRTIRGGPGWVSFTNDQLGAPAAPPFGELEPQPSWWAGAQISDKNLGNNSYNPSWASTGPGYFSTTPADLPPFGDPGQANRVILSSGIGGHYPGNRYDESFCAEYLDDRTPGAAPVYSTIETGRAWTGLYFKLNNKYLHPALFVGNWGTQIQIGDWFEFSQMRYSVQQVSSRGAE